MSSPKQRCGGQQWLEMFDDPFTEFISWAALICTVFQFLTGINVCMQIKSKGSTTDISAFPFIAGIFNCSLWLKYGFLLGDQTLIWVNSIGLALQLSYTMYYYCFTYNKSALHKQLAMTFGILLPILWYLKYAIPDLATASSQAGLISCAAAVMFCASPLGGLTAVLRTKSTENLPLPLILSTFVVTLLWYIYGLLTDNLFIQIPNVLGFGITALQLVLFLIFPRRRILSPFILKD